MAFTLAGLFIGLTSPFAGLAPQGHAVLATVIITLGLWVFRPGNLPYAAGGAFLIAGCLAFGLPYNVAAAGFVSSAVWVLIPALYFGYALQKTGLGKRIAFLILKSFNPSYLTIIISWFITGILLSAMTPSITVRVSIVMPIALSVVEACKLADRSRGAALITLSAWSMAIFPGTGWLTGSLYGPILVGFLPAELKTMANFDTWFQILALPWLIITVIFLLLVYFILKPGQPLLITRDTFLKQYAALGKITPAEIITIITVIAALLAFTTEKYHHIPTAATALAAFFVLIIFGVITVPEISSGVNWDIIIFFGATISLSTIFVNSKISGWLGPILEPGIISLGANSLIFILVSVIILWLIRFIDVPWGFSTAALASTLLVPLYNSFGIHPLIAVMLFTAAGNCFFLSYQQPFLMIGESIAKGKAWSSKHITIAGLAYGFAVIITLLVSLPYWKTIGAIR